MAAVLQGGRSSSQISIYDYPEHLNPFYEEENHKRIRFWTIGKKKKNGRSNSFSFDGIKEFWPLKTFKLKKKSSTLGINKTSESPPVLRRQLAATQYSYDDRMRHTTDPYGTNALFQRGVAYRQSLQDVNTESEFLRNHRYRSTVANGSCATMYNPQHSSKVSQSSLNSTNPFEDDYECPQGSSTPNKQLGDGSSTIARRKKKRRAPAPPGLGINSLQIIENVETPQPDKNTSIETDQFKDLAAEIASFVMISDTSSSDLSRIATQEEPTPAPRSRQTNETTAQLHPSNHGDQWSSETVKVIVTIHNEDDPQLDTMPDVDKKEIICSQNANESRIIETNQLTETIISEHKQCETNKGDAQKQPQPETMRKVQPSTLDYAKSTDNYVINEPASKDLAIETIVASTAVPKRNNRPVEKMEHSPINELNIVETGDVEKSIEMKSSVVKSKPSIPKTKPIIKAVEIEFPTNELKITESEEELNEFAKPPTEFSKFVQRYSSDNNINSSNKNVQYRMADANGSDGDISQQHMPRRRSVKDIIESINKSQSLLKVNQEFKSDPRCDDIVNRPVLQGTSNESLTTRYNLTEIHEQEQKMRYLIEKMETEKEGENVQDIPIVVEQFHNNNNNNNGELLFKKCSPLKVGMREWNPVPKPRRSKHFDDKV